MSESEQKPIKNFDQFSDSKAREVKERREKKNYWTTRKSRRFESE